MTPVTTGMIGSCRCGIIDVGVDAPDQHRDHRGPGDGPLGHEELGDVHFASASVAAESVLSWHARERGRRRSRRSAVRHHDPGARPHLAAGRQRPRPGCCRRRRARPSRARTTSRPFSATDLVDHQLVGGPALVDRRHRQQHHLAVELRADAHGHDHARPQQGLAGRELRIGQRQLRSGTCASARPPPARSS